MFSCLFVAFNIFLLFLIYVFCVFRPQIEMGCKDRTPDGCKGCKGLYSLSLSRALSLSLGQNRGPTHP